MAVVVLLALAIALVRREGSPASSTTRSEPSPPTTSITAASTTPPTTATRSDVVPLGPPPHEEGEPEAEGRGSATLTAQRWPLTQVLPKVTPGWRIDYRVDGDHLVLEVTLRAILNRPEQLAAYERDLRRFKAEALAWLGSVGADPAMFTMEWRPAEAAAL